MAFNLPALICNKLTTSHLQSGIVQDSILSQRLLIMGGSILVNNLFSYSSPESVKRPNPNGIFDKQEAVCSRRNATLKSNGGSLDSKCGNHFDHWEQARSKTFLKKNSILSNWRLLKLQETKPHSKTDALKEQCWEGRQVWQRESLAVPLSSNNVRWNLGSMSLGHIINISWHIMNRFFV